MKKSGFTVVEILICILIIGVLTVITLNVSTKKSGSQYSKLYNTAYDALVQAVGNAYLAWDPDNYMNQDMITDLCLLDGGYYHWSKKCWEIYTATVKNSLVKTYESSKLITILHDGHDIVLRDKDGNTKENSLFGGDPEFPRRYPGFLMGRQHDVGDYKGGRFDGWGGTNEAFCKDLTQYFNTLATDNECMYFVTGLKKEGSNYKSPTIGQSFHDVFCTLMNPTQGNLEPSGNCADTPDDKIVPSFITANGQRFYISGLVTANIPFFGTDEASKKERRYFRFIAVDLNGENGPNRQYMVGGSFPWLTVGSSKADTGSYPDIVLFAITDGGHVIPVGIPEFSTTYATAKVYYPEYISVMNAGEEAKIEKNTALTSSTMSLFNAKLTAWSDDSAQASNLICGQSVMENSPITYSEIFYWIALNCGEDGCNGTTDYEACMGISTNEKTPLKADPLMANLVRQFIFKDLGAEIPIKQSGSSINATVIPSVSSTNWLDQEHGCIANGSKCKVQIESE